MRPNAGAEVSTGCKSVSLPSHSAKAPDETGVHVAPNRIAKLRDAAFAQQRGRCWYCGYQMVPASTVGAPKGRFACTAEHLVPRSEGGPDTSQNIKAACWFCNVTRHKMRMVLTPEAYRLHVRERLAKGKWHPCSGARLHRTSRTSLSASRSRASIDVAEPTAAAVH